MTSPREQLRRLLTPTWGTFLLASVATLAMTYVQWRTWTGGTSDQVTDYSYYWPFYTHSMSGTIAPPSSAALTWNFFAGVAIFYLPAALADRLSKRIVGGLPVPPAVNRVARRLAMRPMLALKTVGFALVASLIPPVFISLFTLPGVVATLLLFTFVWKPFGAAVPGYLHTVDVPVAFVLWYGIFSIGGYTIRRIRGRRDGDVDRTEP